MREIHVEIVGWNVRAFGQKAQVAQIALINDLGVILLCNTVHFEGFRFVDQIEQGREGITKAHAAAAAVADVINPLELCVE